MRIEMHPGSRSLRISLEKALSGSLVNYVTS
jgi:hypothetical protein